MTHHKRCPVRSVVRTSDFHSGNRGSIPLRGTTIGRIAQLGEHLPYKQGVIGSSPIVTTNLITIVGVQLSWLERLPVTQEVASSTLVTPAIIIYAALAHLVEQLTCNQQVIGSIPISGTSKPNKYARMAELADALDLGSSVPDVRVQVSLFAPKLSYLFISNRF